MKNIILFLLLLFSVSSIAQIKVGKLLKYSDAELFQKALYYLALCQESKVEFKESLAICKKAFTINTHSFSYQNLDTKILKIASSCVRELPLQEKAKPYSKLHQQNHQKIPRFITSFQEQDLIATLDRKLKTEKKNSGYYLWGGLTSLLIASYLLWHFLKSLKDKRQFLKIISNLEEQEKKRREQDRISENALLLQSEIVKKAAVKLPETIQDYSEKLYEEEENLEKENKNVNISKETEKKILRMLDRFEKKEQFLSHKITSGSLASDMKTNSVYLSSVLKKYKQNNFNGYINQLRINYIIHKLQNYAEYSTYKISYLATECGFTSHTSFNRIFIQINGITPSKFISLLGKQK